MMCVVSSFSMLAYLRAGSPKSARSVVVSKTSSLRRASAGVLYSVDTAIVSSPSGITTA
jgi:hypothetical protein